VKFNKDQDYWASCYFNKDKFLLIETRSGLGMVATDPLFPPCFLSPDASDERIGEALLEALGNSRTLNDANERVAFFDLDKNKEMYKSWVDNLIYKYGYKNRKSLFKNMLLCSVHLKNEKIKIKPTFHEKLEAWSGNGIKESDYVVLSATSGLSEIGAGLRVAMSRCKP